MKLCRFQPRVVSADKVGTTVHPEVFQGVISGETVSEISGDMLARWSVTNRSWPLTDVKLLPPVLPSKIVCLGRNYVEHAAEFNNPTPKQPLIFLKPPSSLLAPEDPIVLPPAAGAWIMKASLPSSFRRSALSCETATTSGLSLPATRA